MCNRMTGLLFFALLFMILGCAKQHIMLDRAVVMNATEDKITDVRILHEPTRKTARVNTILPKKTLELAFSGQPMLANVATVSWRDSAGVERQVRLDLPYDKVAASDGRLMQLVYVIQSSGRVTAHLEAVMR